ncbi:MAG: UDP-N-acetylenolpyruvoylglucosamine reductase, partial [Bacteroidetes bacterium SW_10_40_5]
MKIPNQAQNPDVFENVSLKPYNTFWVEAQASYFSNVKTIEQLQYLIEDTRFHDIPWLVLGGGSNVLFTANQDGLVLENDIKGKEVIEETADHVWLKAYSGENWHQLVLYCVDRGWGGIENLSLIPGKVGAAPMQNIGAYGVELKDVF